MIPTIDPERRIQTVCLLILTAIAIGTALFFLRPVLIPFVLAVFFVFCLTPVIDVQTRYVRIGRPIAIINTILLGCILLSLLWILVWASVGQLSANAGSYEEQLDQLFQRASTTLRLDRLGFGMESFNTYLNEHASAGPLLRRLASGVMSVLSNGLLVVIFMIFMLAGRPNPAVEGSFRAQVESGIKRYIITKVTVSAVTGLLVGLSLWLFKVELAMVFGLLAFLLNFIPSIGSVVATLLPVPVIVLSPELSPLAKVFAIGIPGGLQFLVGSLIEPRIMGGSLGLHPVVVLLGLIFFGMIWGMIGMLLATPMVAVIKIILERTSLTAPMSEVLAGRLDGRGDRDPPAADPSPG